MSNRTWEDTAEKLVLGTFVVLTGCFILIGLTEIFVTLWSICFG